MTTVNTQLIQEYIQKNNTSRTEFSKKAHITARTLKGILEHKINNITILFKVAQAMNVSVKELLIENA